MYTCPLHTDEQAGECSQPNTAALLSKPMKWRPALVELPTPHHHIHKPPTQEHRTTTEGAARYGLEEGILTETQRQEEGQNKHVRENTRLWNSALRQTVNSLAQRTSRINTNFTLKAHLSQFISLGSFLYWFRWSNSLTISDVLGLSTWENVLMLLETRIFTEEEGTHSYGSGKARENCWGAGGGLGLKTLVWIQDFKICDMHVRAWYISMHEWAVHVCSRVCIHA